MPMHPHLPADVVHCVFGEVIKTDDSRKWVLKKCSLVCQEWCVVARPLLFSKITIKSPCTGIRFYEFFHFIGSRPELARYIQSLKLQEGGDYETFMDRCRNAYTQSDESYVQCRSIAPAGSVEGDGRRRQSAPPIYGLPTAILDYPAFLSVLPLFTGLRILRLRNIALWWEEGTVLDPPPALPLVCVVVDAYHCSLPCLLTGLRSVRLESMCLEDFNFSSRVGIEDPVDQQSEDTRTRLWRNAPSRYFEYACKPIDFSALQYLFIRPPPCLPINVESLCLFLRTLAGAGIVSFRLKLRTDRHSQSDTIPDSPEVCETLWDAVGKALMGLKKLKRVTLEVPVHLPTHSDRYTLFDDYERHDMSAVEMAAPRTFATFPDITPAVTAVLAHPAAPSLSLILEEDMFLGYMSESRRHCVMAPHLLKDLSVLDDICFKHLRPTPGFDDERQVTGACRDPERSSASREDERPCPRLSIAVDKTLVPWANSRRGRVEPVLRAMSKLGSSGSDLLRIEVF